MALSISTAPNATLLVDKDERHSVPSCLEVLAILIFEWILENFLMVDFYH